MHDQLITAVVAEIAPVLVGRTLGKVWQTARAVCVFDFRVRDERYLLISVEPDALRIHLVKRAVRELEQQALQPDQFLLMLRKHINGATLLAVTKDAADRIVRFRFAARDAAGGEHAAWLVAQLTGRAANILLLDEAERIVAMLRPARGAEIGAPYQPPPPRAGRTTTHDTPTPFTRGAFATVSEAADDYYQTIEAARTFAARAGALNARLRQESARREKLRHNLERDLAAHGEAEDHKRVGDLLLANIGTAVRAGTRVRLTDYYTEGTPTVELEIDEHATLQAEAARRLARYAKAKRAAQELGTRLATLRAELDALAARRAELDEIVATGNAIALDAFATQLDERGARRATGSRRTGQKDQAQPRATAKEAGKAAEQAAVARRYLSSDGYEILVGRGARANDQLTFRIARPQDLWLHAADYPGSHVVVRNPRRTDIPQRTVIEAAQLAANYSQAKNDAKVAVNYTQRKFIAKPKGAAPGLVRMANFRTLLVEPRESGERA